MQIMNRSSGAHICLDVIPIILEEYKRYNPDFYEDFVYEPKTALIDLSTRISLHVYLGTQPGCLPFNQLNEIFNDTNIDIGGIFLEESEIAQLKNLSMFDDYLIPRAGHLQCSFMSSKDLVDAYSASMMILNGLPMNPEDWDDDIAFNVARKYIETFNVIYDIPTIHSFIPLIVTKMPGYFHDLMSRALVITSLSKARFTGFRQCKNAITPRCSMRTIGSFIDPWRINMLPAKAMFKDAERGNADSILVKIRR